ncbi:hypothetical protein ACFLWS_03810 [Chloroflexota bacterium]
MKRRQNQKPLKMNIVFTPVQDWDARLKRVMEILLRRPYDKNRDNKEGGGENA